MRSSARSQNLILLGVIVGLAALGAGVFIGFRPAANAPAPEDPKPDAYQPRQELETSGFLAVFAGIEPWRPDASLEQYAAAYANAIPRGHSSLDIYLSRGFHPGMLIQRANLFHAKGDPAAAYQALDDLQTRITGTGLEKEWLYTVIFYKGVTSLRAGENDNCVMCRGQSACIFPIAPSAVHTNPAGSRKAIGHFTEYLRAFPDDLEVKWLLNLAHATLGEHPSRVDPRHLLSFDAHARSEFDVGRFEDVSHRVGLERLNQSGGAIMDDFDNDGLFDVVVTCWAPAEPLAFYRNDGKGAFEDRTGAAGLGKQVGGLYCVQTDYNNDGHLDVFVPRGSWMPAHLSQRPSLLRNNGNGTFTDVTHEAGLAAPTNSTSAAWADYDNDGHLDLFVCCQQQPCLLYRNRGDGTFEAATARAGLPADLTNCLGAAWIDIDNDRFPDLFVNISTGLAGRAGTGTGRLFRNNRNGTFTDVTREAGIDGPTSGFSCWAFDYDNDGWLDIFATTTSHTLAEVVQGLLDLPCDQASTAKLFRNLGGRGFRDVTREVGLTKVYSPMGSNFGDIDNDGYLDFYLATGDPGLSTLIPNRLFRNVLGRRFAEVTASTRTGHLQKGHGVAFGDWDRNGTQDLFVELGGAVHGDRYHNVLFQNPGQGNNWLSVKLVGKQTNRAAIGARIKVVTAGDQPLTVHRHVSSGSSFGANPLEQHVGVGKAGRVARLEVFWPTSGTTQVFTDIAVNQGVVITEFATDYQARSWRPIALPE
ncbi:MAG TPA: CRTAC1 family protein [Urbifossiella sp.]|nr:CRTAC1 family protein [Urbifossiella sp.]